MQKLQDLIPYHFRVSAIEMQALDRVYQKLPDGHEYPLAYYLVCQQVA